MTYDNMVHLAVTVMKQKGCKNVSISAPYFKRAETVPVRIQWGDKCCDLSHLSQEARKLFDEERPLIRIDLGGAISVRQPCI